jgi:hypothetical protein
MRILTAAFLFATAAVAAVPAAADCKDEVLAALAKQRKAPAFRMDSAMLSEQGPMRMVVDYLQPDRMRQVVSLAISPDKSTETILIGSTAWGRDGTGWTELSPDITREIINQREETLGEDAGTIGTVACLGSTAIDGRELIAYRIENDAQVGPVDRSPDAKANAAKALADETRPLRMFYVDPASGLPARSVFARANKLDKPIFKADYSYGSNIKIEPPK